MFYHNHAKINSDGIMLLCTLDTYIIIGCLPEIT